VPGLGPVQGCHGNRKVALDHAVEGGWNTAACASNIQRQARAGPKSSVTTTAKNRS